MPPFTYDVFISYSHVDVEWARRVDTALRGSANRYRTFFDESSLRAGDDWEATIQSALETSQHLVVLRSNQESPWVTREYISFMTVAKPKTDSTRRLIMLNLEGLNQAMRSYQQISDPDVQAAYPDIARMTATTWRTVLRQIEQGLNPAQRIVTVPLVVLTAKLEELLALKAERRRWLLEDFGLTPQALEDRYGEERHAWRPFGGAAPIGDILDRLPAEIDTGQYRFEWKQPDDTFWTDALAASEFVKNEFKASELAVLIIDPVAVYEPERIYPRLMLFQECLADERVTIVALPPFTAPDPLVKLRQALLSRTVPYFTDYFEPRVPPARKLLAQCGWNVVDTADVRRLLVAAAGRLPAAPRDARSPYVSQG